MTAAHDAIVTRFAPSPSGHLHVGGARTALFCWAYARRFGGRFILRIEDTDQKRSSDAASLAFLADLAWLGIGWDEGPEHDGNGGGDAGPYFCSERLDVYREQVDRLIADGHAYRAFETPEELDAARAAARAAGRDYRYDRAALELDQATIDAYLAEGRPHVVRFKVPDVDEVVVNDEVLGEVRVARAMLDDFVIVKADGFPTYHFAVVVDDELMGVTHVIRGAGAPQQHAAARAAPGRAGLPPSRVRARLAHLQPRRLEDVQAGQGQGAAPRREGGRDRRPARGDGVGRSVDLVDGRQGSAARARRPPSASPPRWGSACRRSTSTTSAAPATSRRSSSTTSRCSAGRPGTTSSSSTATSSSSASTSTASSSRRRSSTGTSCCRSTTTRCRRCRPRTSRPGSGCTWSGITRSSSRR